MKTMLKALKNRFFGETVNKYPRYILFGVLIFFGLYLSSQYNYLFFHSIAEVFSILIAFSIFIIAWNSRLLINNNYLLFIGIAFLFVGCTDFLHTLSYRGMAIFDQRGSNIPTQLWIAARYMQSISFFIAPLFFRRNLKAGIIFCVYMLAFFLLILSIFYWKVFPACFVEGTGLTTFKKISEYIISFILLASVALLLRHRDKFDRVVFQWVIWSIFLTIASELAFTFYIDAYGLSNLVGHYLKIIAFWFLYKALVETGLNRPYNLIFRDLKQSEEKYRSLFANMINGFARHKVLFDREGKPVDYVFLEVNSAFEKITGLNGEDLIGKRVTEVLPGIEKDSAGWIEKYGRVALTGESIRFENYSKPLKRWYGVLAYSTEKGYFVSIFEDITERKLAEEAMKEARDKLEVSVQERTAELSMAMEQLERSNRELREFAFVASHDLQEPLRKIRTFGDLLLSKCADSLSETGRDYVDRMQKASLRMKRLIDSLLTYSRVSTKETPFSLVDLNKAVKEALANLEIRIEETKASVELDALPIIEADGSQMIQLFQNLIGNALKFHRKGDQPRIRIYAHPVDSKRSSNSRSYNIFVEDKGIGFEEKYLDRIFTPFQRLHERGVYDGVGMGLAICNRIVEQHNGRIAGKSAVNRGSTFIVTLPERQGKK